MRLAFVKFWDGPHLLHKFYRKTCSKSAPDRREHMLGQGRFTEFVGMIALFLAQAGRDRIRCQVYCAISTPLLWSNNPRKLLILKNLPHLAQHYSRLSQIT